MPNNKRSYTSIDFGTKGSEVRFIIEELKKKGGRGFLSKYIRGLILADCKNDGAFKKQKLKTLEFELHQLLKQKIALAGSIEKIKAKIEECGADSESIYTRICNSILNPELEVMEAAA